MDVLKKQIIVQRFMDKVSPEPNSGCWIWTGSLDVCGYARFGFDGRNSKASRVSLTLFKGITRIDGNACHKCDNRACVNPDHLYVGTQLDNMSDSIRRGTFQRVRGERKPLAKLTRDAVRDIRSKRLSTVEFAKLYGVATCTVRRVVRRDNWNHI